MEKARRWSSKRGGAAPYSSQQSCHGVVRAPIDAFHWRPHALGASRRWVASLKSRKDGRLLSGISDSTDWLTAAGRQRMRPCAALSCDYRRISPPRVGATLAPTLRRFTGWRQGDACSHQPESQTAMYFLDPFVHQPVFVLMLACALPAMVLRMFTALGRRELRSVWVLLVLGAIAMVAAQLLLDLGSVAWSGRLDTAAWASVVLALLQLLVVLLFQVLMPALGVQAPRIMQDLSFVALALGGGLYGLAELGVHPGQIFTTSAIFTAVLAFAMQDTLGNVLGGVMLQLDNSLNVGDYVLLDDIAGYVVDVRWRYTAIETTDYETIVIPNSSLVKNRFRVLRPRDALPVVWRRTLVFDIDPQVSPQTVIDVMGQAARDGRMENVATKPAASAVLVEVTAGYNRFALRYGLTAPAHDSSTDSMVRMHVLAGLQRAGIALGAPQEQHHRVNDSDQRDARESAEMQQRVRAVQRTPLFASLSEQEHSRLAASLVHTPFVKGGVMTHQGAVAHWLYLIVKGQAQVLVEERGQTTPIRQLSDGDFFGEMGLLTGEPRSATVVALTEVDCYRLDKAGLAQILAQRHDLASEISQVLNQRQQDLTDRVENARGDKAALRAEDLLAKVKSFFGLGSDKPTSGI